MKNSVKNILAFSIFPQIVLVKWLGSYPDLVERYYAQGLYPYVSRFLRILFGWLPFSVGDLFYTVLAFALFRYVYLNFKSFRKQPKKILQHLGITLSLAYFIFHLFWGMNYYRVPIDEKFKIESTYSIDELEGFTQKLIDKTNDLQFQLTKDTISSVVMPDSRKEIFEGTIEAYKNLAQVYPEFSYQHQSLKKSLYSLPLTYMGYGGYLNPFTGEAQVNSLLPLIRFPTVSGHEVGHQIGYSSESATNFIGFLVTSKSESIYFKYAAYSHALAYCLSDLRRLNEERFTAVWNSLNIGVKKNYEEINMFWKQYQNVTEPVFKAVFNAFLKANSQAEGIESYNSVVGLLVNYDKRYGF
ncbi:DUF3810 domain-containing protein [uncultured Croceitalea sp.]|uniref:DUF3810 domain-containing protein n=1 Tax=uncultured Croceitalea sp. TaxID=1798908 RepID=UPI003305F05F